MRPESKPKTIYKKKLLIICEGENTEPLFFDELMKFAVNNETFKTWIDYYYCEGSSINDVRIDPVPPHVQDNSENTGRGQTKSLVNKRKVNTDSEDQKELLREDKGTAQPLNWVKRGIKNHDMFEQVWCVFDNDERNIQGLTQGLGKSSLEQAFKEAGNNNINIAYSNRCFEYFLLQHFELNIKAFDECECKDKVLKYKCKTDNQGVCVESKDLNYKGKTCINGYARYKKYWINSKSKENAGTSKSVFSLTSKLLMNGVCNSYLARKYVCANSPQIINLWDYNPYTDVDKLVLRLIGVHELERNNVLEIKNGTIATSVTNNDTEISLNLIYGSLSVVKVFCVNRLDYSTAHETDVRLTATNKSCSIPKSSDKVYIIQIE